MTSLYRLIDRCRSCDSDRLDSVLDLGDLAISDFVTDPSAPVDRAPLELVRCDACSLVQLSATVDRDRLYKRYFYRSGLNETMRAALKDVVDDAMALVDLKPDDSVLDLGSNDRTLLNHYPPWLTRVGFEPSESFVDPEAEFNENIAIFQDYWPPRVPFKKPSFKVISSIAAFYNVDDPNAYVAAIKDALHPDGVWIVQFQDLRSMLAANAVDNICHEHLALYDELAFAALLGRHGLELSAVTAVPVNGGSLRFTIRHAGGPHDWVYGYRHPIFKDDLAAFAERALSNRMDARALLLHLVTNGGRVFGYAASTKASTLLQWYTIGPGIITAFAERNPQKVGLYIAGTGIPIWSEDAVRAARPTALWVGAWQFREAFIEREQALLDAGTRMIFPLPNVEIVSAPARVTVEA